MKKAIAGLMLAAFLSAGATSVLAQTISKVEKKEEKSTWVKTKEKVKADTQKVKDKLFKHKEKEEKK